MMFRTSMTTPRGIFTKGITYKIPPKNDPTMYKISFLNGQKRKYGTLAVKKMSIPK